MGMNGRTGEARNFSGGIIEQALPPPADVDFRLAARQAMRDLAPESAPPAGDENDFAGKRVVAKNLLRLHLHLSHLTPAQ